MRESDSPDSGFNLPPIAGSIVVINTDGMLTGNKKDMTVFLVDDSALVRNRLAGLLNDIEGVLVVGAVGNVVAAIEGIAITHPDFVVLDFHLREGSGIEVLE